ncbi:hypothetical protein V8E53_006390 [Lactarius tabidus]
MSLETRTSILDAALVCIGNRISTILLQSGNKDKNYITSLHNKMLAAMWIVEPIKVAFGSFSDIRNPGSYTSSPFRSLLLQGKEQSSDSAKFKFTEWWKIGEGETMEEPFDICDELVEGFLHALDMLGDAHTMVTHIEGQVESIEKMFNDGYSNLSREFGLQEKARSD